MLCWFLPYNNTNQPYVYLRPLPPHPHPTLDHHRAPGWAPYVIQQLPIGSLFSIWQCRCISAIFKRDCPGMNYVKLVRRQWGVRQLPSVSAAFLVMSCHPPPPGAMVKLCPGWTIAVQDCFYYWHRSLNRFLSVGWPIPTLAQSRNLYFQSLFL